MNADLLPTEAQLRTLARCYLAALEAAALDDVLALFAPGAQVDSPLYGALPAADFYPQLFRDTVRSRTRLLSVLGGRDVESGAPTAAIHFHYEWDRGTDTVGFDVVDVLQLDENGLILRLSILYDAGRTRR